MAERVQSVQNRRKDRKAAVRRFLLTAAVIYRFPLYLYLIYKEIVFNTDVFTG